ncbi:MAG: acyltransferase [Acidobacteria bacterium]|nr:acyltransferase [Acidobacteriota bacterium]
MSATIPRRIITRGRRFIAEVDGLRFVAITAVVLSHVRMHTLLKHMNGAAILPAESWVPHLLGMGTYGVQLFFVLSGFLLSLPFAKARLGLAAKPSLRSYYLRRLTRLEPPYIVSMLLLFVGGFVALGMATGLSRWPNLIASLFYQHNLIYGASSPVNLVAWSLEVEVQFYLLAPALAIAFSIRNLVVRRTIFLAAMMAIPWLRTFIPPNLAEGAIGFPWSAEFFIAGFFLADLYLLDWKENPPRSLGWDVASLLGWAFLVMITLSGRFDILIAPGILITYIGVFRGRVSNWVFRRPLITMIGGMCYSIYLLHLSVISLTERIAKKIPLGSSFTARFAIDASLAIPAILVVSTIFFVLLERPCMDPTWPAKARERVRNWLRGPLPDRESAVSR